MEAGTINFRYGISRGIVPAVVGEVKLYATNSFTTNNNIGCRNICVICTLLLRIIIQNTFINITVFFKSFQHLKYFCIF